MLPKLLTVQHTEVFIWPWQKNTHISIRIIIGILGFSRIFTEVKLCVLAHAPDKCWIMAAHRKLFFFFALVFSWHARDDICIIISRFIPKRNSKAKDTNKLNDKEQNNKTETATCLTLYTNRLNTQCGIMLIVLHHVNAMIHHHTETFS